MNREDVEGMAGEAGWGKADSSQDCMACSFFDLERFAALVAAHEREACAKVCEVGVDYPHPIVKGVVVKNFGGSNLLAAAIRSRGEVQP